MAKALIGHLPAPMPALRSVRSGPSEAQRLRSRVAELEALVLRLQQENDALAAAAVDSVVTPAAGDLQPV